MKDNKESYKKLFAENEPQLDLSEKDKLFHKIVKSGRRKKIRRYTINFAAVSIVFFLGFHFFAKEVKHQDNLDIIAISSINKKISLGLESPTLLISDVSGHTLKIDSSLNTKTDKDKIFHIESSLTNSVGYSSIYVPFGQRKEVLLPDGSKVWLNAGSILTFNNNMNETARIVHLDGEGFFDVKKNKQPFSIFTSQSIIKVLGTSFNLSSYEKDNFLSLDLLTGKVEFESINGKFPSFNMAPGQRVNYDYHKNLITKDSRPQGDDILWTKKQLVLNNSTIEALFNRLEKIYNIQIVYGDFLQTNVPYSGRLNLDVDIISALQSIYELRTCKIYLKERKVIIDE